MSELGPKMRPRTQMLLQRAARGYEPSPDDRARVRAGIARRLAIGAVAAGAGAVATKSAAASIAPGPIVAAGAAGAAGAAAAGGAGAGAAVAGGASIAVKLVVSAVLVGSVGAGAASIASHRAKANEARVAAPVSASNVAIASNGAATRPTLPNGVVLPDVPPEAPAPSDAIANTPSPAPSVVAATPPALIDRRLLPGGRGRPMPTPDPEVTDDRSALAEVGLVRDAEVALRGGDPALALGLADEHARRFPFGALAEEREAVRVFALCGLGRVVEASAESAIFLSAHPRSPIADRVRSSCGQKK